MAEISKITIPNPLYGQPGEPATVTYDIKDAVARAAIVAGFTFHICTNAANTPYGVTWYSGSTLITGTLVASGSTTGFYLVPASQTETKDIYDEYVTVIVSGTGESGDPYVYAWERLGNTEIDFRHLASYLDTVVSAPTDEVLGSSTTFTTASSAVTFTGDSSDTFVKSYPGASSKLSTTTILGLNNSTTSTASHVASSSSKTFATRDSSATAISYVGNASTTSVLGTATVADGSETLVIGTVGVSQGSVTGTNGTDTVTNFTFSDVTVPVAASQSTTVATGSLAADAQGASVLTGLGTATTASAVTSVGTGTAAAQTITVGTNDLVDSVTGVSVTIVDKNS